ncbi:MAG: hypothetical protein C4K48_06490 [Candidatus Thorarchaeota archaeon]|nr:MAG: hypothetical protein C4K48_06490 [Candidatus Thorarchaeota archaeon]
MEKTVETESLGIEFDVVPDIQEEVTVTESRKRAKRIFRARVEKHLYAKSLGGLAAIIALLSVPLVTLPAMVIPVLIAEVYLLDWTYSKFSLLRNPTSSASSEPAGKRPEDEVDRKVTRTGPKDQFVK